MRDWPFDPRNVADLIDVVTLPEYPENGKLAESTDRVRYFASHGRPLVLGETFMLFCDRLRLLSRCCHGLCPPRAPHSPITR